MTQRSTRAAETRAAPAALTRLSFADIDRYLLIDDSDDDITQIICVMRESSKRELEVQP